VIRVSLAALVTIYLLLFLAAVFLLWIVGEWKRGRRERRALQHRVRCVLCAFEFEDRTDTLLPRCPRCGSLNERFKLERI
jgi:sensor domain CHASE-containing protein